MATFVTDAGRALETNLVSGLGGTAPTYTSIGSGTTPAARTDTALTTEYTNVTWTGYARVQSTAGAGTLTRFQGTAGVPNDSIKWVATFTAGATETVAEAGIFDVVTLAAGNMLIHGNFTGVALSAGDSIQLTTTLQYT